MIGTKNKIITYMLNQDDSKRFEVKEYKEKRSRDANAYCWVLCDIIAKELSKDGTIVTKEVVYKDAIEQVGVFTTEIWQEKEFEFKKKDWESRGLGFIVQEIARKDKCVKVLCYYGSHTYNTKEMSLLIQILVELAESLNIETKTQAEINSLLEAWR